MIDTKKPRAAKEVLTPTSTAPLTADEQRWLAVWRAMDDEYRHRNLILMEGQARRHPRHARPVLRLVGGAK